MICYVCGAEGTYPDPRNPLCLSCAPAAAHVVSIMTDRAKCNGCGWTFESEDWDARAGAVRAHWRAVIAEQNAA